MKERNNVQNKYNIPVARQEADYPKGATISLSKRAFSCLYTLSHSECGYNGSSTSLRNSNLKSTQLLHKNTLVVYIKYINYGREALTRFSPRGLVNGLVF